VLLVWGHLDGPLQSPLKGVDLGPLLGELSLKIVDAGLRRGTIHGFNDLLGLAVERLSRLLAVLCHRGDVAVAAAEDGEGAGDPLRDRGHEAHSIEANRGHRPSIAHVPTGTVHRLPRQKAQPEKVPDRCIPHNPKTLPHHDLSCPLAITGGLQSPFFVM